VFPALADIAVQQFESTATDKYLGYVDAENGFGALIRTHFTCVVKYANGGYTVRVYMGTT